MADKHCGNCGEPWEMYYVNDRWDELLSEDELEAGPDNMKAFFMKGKGCPACEWGKKESKEGAHEQHVKDLLDASVTDEDPMKYI